jgi:hypothetical protein
MRMRQQVPAVQTAAPFLDVMPVSGTTLRLFRAGWSLLARALPKPAAIELIESHVA